MSPSMSNLSAVTGCETDHEDIPHRSTNHLSKITNQISQINTIQLPISPNSKIPPPSKLLLRCQAWQTSNPNHSESGPIRLHSNSRSDPGTKKEARVVAETETESGRNACANRACNNVLIGQSSTSREMLISRNVTKIAHSRPYGLWKQGLRNVGFSGENNSTYVTERKQRSSAGVSFPNRRDDWILKRIGDIGFSGQNWPGRLSTENTMGLKALKLACALAPGWLRKATTFGVGAHQKAKKYRKTGFL